MRVLRSVLSIYILSYTYYRNNKELIRDIVNTERQSVDNRLFRTRSSTQNIVVRYKTFE